MSAASIFHPKFAKVPKIIWFFRWMGCLAAAILFALFVQKQLLFFALDAKIYDSGLASRTAQTPDNIIIAGLTDAFVGDSHVSQMPRGKLARLINALVDAKPAVIAVDVWLDSKVKDGAENGDEKLRQALLRAQKLGVPVVLAQLNDGENESGKGTTAHGAIIPFFANAATAVGGVAFTPDTDKLVRLMPDETVKMPSLPYLAAWYSLKDSAARQKVSALRQSNFINLRPINFYGSPDLQNGQKPTVRIHDAQEIVDTPYLAPFLAAQKIVFVGATFLRSTDLLQTPYNNVGVRRKFYGVELLANATFTYRDGALRDSMRFSHESLAVQNKILLLALFVASLTALAALYNLWAGVLMLSFGSIGPLFLGLISAGENVQLWPHFWPPSPVLTATLVAWMMGAALRQKATAAEVKLVRGAFGGYVGPEILSLLEKGPPQMGGETRQVAILFCDIQGFSALAESLQNDPSRVLQMLNNHFDPLVEILKKRGAYVDNYVGDLIMAVFGAPYSQGSFAADVNAAVQAALDFDRVVAERNAERKENDEMPIEVGIGVHCGSVVAGHLGSQSRMHYTTIGDAVNIAARVESETRHHPTRLLVTEEVTGLCPEFRWQFMAETVVKGRSAPVRLYTVSSDEN